MRIDNARRETTRKANLKFERSHWLKILSKKVKYLATSPGKFSLV